MTLLQKLYFHRKGAKDAKKRVFPSFVHRQRLCVNLGVLASSRFKKSLFQASHSYNLHWQHRHSECGHSECGHLSDAQRRRRISKEQYDSSCSRRFFAPYWPVGLRMTIFVERQSTDCMIFICFPYERAVSDDPSLCLPTKPAPLTWTGTPSASNRSVRTFSVWCSSNPGRNGMPAA